MDGQRWRERERQRERERHRVYPAPNPQPVQGVNGNTTSMPNLSGIKPVTDLKSNVKEQSLKIPDFLKR